jgi:hypothetical protein
LFAQVVVWPEEDPPGTPHIRAFRMCGTADHVYGRPATLNGTTTAVYDAFQRLVEMQGSSTTQIVYAPDGWKFAT